MKGTITQKSDPVTSDWMCLTSAIENSEWFFKARHAELETYKQKTLSRIVFKLSVLGC